ncbi:hypothetical protein UY3_06487 [Chelonia mydas]|uniref:Uncharacterized protein n=1 Tax=Chelonia mydas TaxID=8469 RepID=M7BGL0_CHEMY|nr:hypothetical protein UY3_06487 [Chelonia mydas]
MNKDVKRLDLYGRQIYSTACQQLHITNHQALRSRYHFNVWPSMAKFADSLPQDFKQEFSAMLDEGRAIARASLQATSDAADSTARAMASVVSMRASWLQLSGLSVEVQQSIQDFLFDDSALFAEQTNRFYRLKDSRATLHSLGLYIPALARNRFKLSTCRGS